MPWWVFYCVVKYSTDYVPLCICYIDLLKSTSMIYGNVMVKSTSPDHDAARCQSRFRLLVRCRVLQVTGIFKLDSESWCTNAHTFSPASLKGSTCMCGTKWLLLDSTTKLRHTPHVHLTTQWLVWHRQCLFYGPGTPLFSVTACYYMLWSSPEIRFSWWCVVAYLLYTGQ